MSLTKVVKHTGMDPTHLVGSCARKAVCIAPLLITQQGRKCPNRSENGLKLLGAGKRN